MEHLGVGLVYKLLAALGTTDTPPTAYHQLALAIPAIGRQARVDREEELPADNRVDLYSPAETARLVFYATYYEIQLATSHAPDDATFCYWFANDSLWRWWDLPSEVEHRQDHGLIRRWHMLDDGDTLYHREHDKPAMIADRPTPGRLYVSGPRGTSPIDIVYTMVWYQYGRIHRANDKPAIANGSDTAGDRCWLWRDHLHRLGGMPAVMMTVDGRAVARYFVRNHEVMSSGPFDDAWPVDPPDDEERDDERADIGLFW